MPWVCVFTVETENSTVNITGQFMNMYHCLKCKILNDIYIGAAKWWVSLSGKIGAKLTNNKLPPAPQTINLVRCTMYSTMCITLCTVLCTVHTHSNGFPIPGWISTGFSFLLFLLLPISVSLLFTGELSSKVCSSFTWFLWSGNSSTCGMWIDGNI